MRCLTLNACKIFCTNFPGCHPPFSYSRRHTLSDYVGGPLCQSGHGYPSRYVRPAAALLGDKLGVKFQGSHPLCKGPFWSHEFQLEPVTQAVILTN